MSELNVDLERGREHHAERAWADAFDALSAADAASALEAEDLERLAWSAALIGRDAEHLAACERLYDHYAKLGRHEDAARWAFWSGFRLAGLGEHGRASGWLSRAERLLEHVPGESVVRGYLLLPVCYRQLASGAPEAAQQTARAAAGHAERAKDMDLLAFARNLEGRAVLRLGHIASGLALLDESMLCVASAAVSPIIQGLVYCASIAHCQSVYALDRAREWTAALDAWTKAQPQLVTFVSTCLVHRAQVLELCGEWSQALAEVDRAQDPRAAGDVMYQRAELRRLRGEFELAEELYRAANQHGREPQPGFALLRLAQGRGAAALSALRRVVSVVTPALERARYLPALVEVLLARGELEEARRAADELEAAALSVGSDVLSAIAAQARGTVLIAAEDPRAALPLLRRAFEVWREVGAPYRAARVRVALARACRALDDEDGAALELEAARDTFLRLGAMVDLAACDASAPAAAGRRAHPLTARELEVLRLVARGETNKAIAKRLSLSEKTVDRHLSNIFSKVNVATRSAATAYAYENGLV